MAWPTLVVASLASSPAPHGRRAGVPGAAARASASLTPSSSSPRSCWVAPLGAPAGTARCRRCLVAGMWPAGRYGVVAPFALRIEAPMDFNLQPGAVGRRERSLAGSQDRFAGWAQRYEMDALSRLLTALQLRAIAHLSITAADRFLDVGCATGAAVRGASATVSLAVGIDRSAAMVRSARARAASLPNEVFLVADAEQLPFPAATFTAVLSTSTLRHLSDPVRAVRELARVVRPGGRVVVADFLACGTVAERHWRNGLGRRRREARWVDPLQAVSAAPIGVIEVVRFSTAFGYYAMAAAAKPDVPALNGGRRSRRQVARSLLGVSARRVAG
ncbi:MAG TPA: methyltransferase domain-containing protein [Actinomycetes bacterium]